MPGQGLRVPMYTFFGTGKVQGPCGSRKWPLCVDSVLPTDPRDPLPWGGQVMGVA